MILRHFMQRVVETTSLGLMQTAELSRAAAAGKLSAAAWLKGAWAIACYNTRHFWSPEPDPAHSVSEIMARR
ncbi:MAG: hypothetical protein ACM33T_07965 [Solirubrobacterales bacterium]